MTTKKQTVMRPSHCILRMLLVFTLVLAGCQSQATSLDPYSTLADEISAEEIRLLETWYPRVLDEEHGGYLTDFDADWALAGPQNKMIVTQARHVWTASQAAMRYPENSMYLNVAMHGYQFLREAMWDEEHGGFYTLVSQTGTPILTGGNANKTAYGNAFGVYALAALAQASESTEVLDFAQRAFYWLEENSHDPDQLGYFQFLEQDGTPIKQGFNGTPPKDQNSSIHLLEAFTELYRIWPHKDVRRRLEEMLVLIRDTMVLDNKYLQLFFQEDWTPLSYRDSSVVVREANYYKDHVSVGHDIETAFLMLDAAKVLGIPTTQTLEAGKSMVDHALAVGWDQSGGFYDYVYYLPGDDKASVIIDTKNWWAQAEGLNSLLLMHTHFPDDPNTYFEKFKTQWTFTSKNLIDHERGGWYGGSLDKQPERINSAKSGIWKGSYHTVRSLMHCADMLKKLQNGN